METGLLRAIGSLVSSYFLMLLTSREAIPFWYEAEFPLMSRGRQRHPGEREATARPAPE